MNEQGYTLTETEEKQWIANLYKDLLKDSYRVLSDDDKKLIRRSFNLAADAHKNQRRKSGEPYITHPIAVAKIVANEIGLGATSIAAALMHDVVEDTDYTLQDIENIFDKRMANIIDGLTKISILNKQDISLQSENYRKLLLTLSEDVRVILIKIADRLHNMRTLDSMKPEKQMKIASETLFIYAPLAHRMGLYNIKSELEDLSLKYTQPEDYFSIKEKIKETKESRHEYIENFANEIRADLEAEGIKFEIKGRPKSIFSIYRKMETQHVSFEEVFDNFAIRIIYQADSKNEKFMAWKIYSLVTDRFTPNLKRLRDWISQPKSTGYESLHITVLGPLQRWVEVQIRSVRMDELAEKGIAAHYKYKENYKVEDSKVDEWINQVRDILESNDIQDTTEFIDNFKLNLYAKEIFVFTPKGELLSLPKGAVALDFAYAIHTGVGDTCLGAKVNGKLVPLSHELESGDNVEIITSKQQKPKSNWLNFVITSKAKSKIKASLNAEKRNIANLGKEQLQRKLRHMKIPFNEKTVNQLVVFFNTQTSQDLFFKIGNEEIDNKELKKFAERNSGVYGFINRFRPKTSPKKPKTEEEENNSRLDDLVFGPDEEKLTYSLATCCNPIPGDKVFGFLTINQGIKVHKMNCPNAVSLRANYDYRILKAKWIDSSEKSFSAVIHISGIDRFGLIREVTEVLSDSMHLNIKSMNISEDDGIFVGKVSVFVKNKNQLDEVIKKLKKVESIQDVRRTVTN